MTYAEAIAAARAAYGPDPPSFAVLDPRGEFLRGKAASIHAQYGEDGLLAAVFERIGTTSVCCFEVGAGDGVELSNTKAMRDDGWSATLVEASAELCIKLIENEAGRSTCIHAKITPENIDKILGYRVNPDLGVIDIDGEDAAVFDALQCRPRVMLVEYNALGDGPWCLGGPWQAGFDTVVSIGRKKGYVPLARTSCNVLFVDEAALDIHECPR